jgi:hypothetical protein
MRREKSVKTIFGLAGRWEANGARKRVFAGRGRASALPFPPGGDDLANGLLE